MYEYVNKADWWWVFGVWRRFLWNH